MATKANSRKTYVTQGVLTKQTERAHHSKRGSTAHALKSFLQAPSFVYNSSRRCLCVCVRESVKQKQHCDKL